MGKITRRTADLTAYPDLVVMTLGMRARGPRGWWTTFVMGPKITRSVKEKPDGLLLHENFLHSLWPLSVGMRQCWRDRESLERWAHADPHRAWWQSFLRGGTGIEFWHEICSARGGVEGVYIDVTRPAGFQRFERSEKTS